MAAANSPANAPAPYARLRTLAVALTALAGAGLLVAGVTWETLSVPATPWRLEGELVAAAGLVILAGSAWLPRWRPRPAIAVAVGVCSAAGLLIVGQRAPERGDRSTGLVREARVWSSANDWFQAIVDTEHPRYGQGMKPGTQGRDHSRDFDVTYTIDGQGWRAMPPSQAPQDRPPLVFLGCSFTFGVGVNDHETYVAQLATRAWPEERLLNRALLAWGTNHALLALDEALEAKPPPAAVFYGYITGHAERNYLGRQWRAACRTQFPLYELVDDRLEYAGLVPPERATLDPSPELTAQETRLTVRMIRELAARSAARGVPFTCLVLQRRADPVLAELESDPSFPLLDVSHVSNDIFAHNCHPTPGWHQAVARALASDRRLAERLGRPQLFRPDAIGPVPPRWVVSTPEGQRGEVRLTTRGAGEETVLRLEGIENPDWNSPWNVQVQRGHLDIESGQTCRVTFRARADSPRVLMVAIETLGLRLGTAESVNLTPQWQEFHFERQAEGAVRGLFMSLLAGQSPTPLELADLRLTVDDTIVLTGIRADEVPRDAVERPE